MTYHELMNEVAKDTGLRVKDVRTMFKSFIKTTKKNLEDGEVVKITGLGSFKMHITEERTVKGFGKTFDVPPMKKVKFTVSKSIVASENIGDYLNKL